MIFEILLFALDSIFSTLLALSPVRVSMTIKIDAVVADRLPRQLLWTGGSCLTLFLDFFFLPPLSLLCRFGIFPVRNLPLLCIPFTLLQLPSGAEDHPHRQDAPRLLPEL